MKGKHSGGGEGGESGGGGGGGGRDLRQVTRKKRTDQMLLHTLLLSGLPEIISLSSDASVVFSDRSN